MAEVFVDDDALYEHGVFELAADFRLDFDEFEVDILALHVGHRQDGVHRDLRHLSVTLVDTAQ